MVIRKTRLIYKIDMVSGQLKDKLARNTLLMKREIKFETREINTIINWVDDNCSGLCYLLYVSSYEYRISFEHEADMTLFMLKSSEW